jgi:hypothetical protein
LNTHQNSVPTTNPSTFHVRVPCYAQKQAKPTKLKIKQVRRGRKALCLQLKQVVAMKYLLYLLLLTIATACVGVACYLVIFFEVKGDCYGGGRCLPGHCGCLCWCGVLLQVRAEEVEDGERETCKDHTAAPPCTEIECFSTGIHYFWGPQSRQSKIN